MNYIMQKIQKGEDFSLSWVATPILVPWKVATPFAFTTTKCGCSSLVPISEFIAFSLVPVHYNE
jgi:hypothetical protein